VAAKAILDAAPQTWSLAATIPDKLPQGYRWSSGANQHGGTQLVLVGPRDVNFSWRDHAGDWHSEALAKEALKVWIMPGYFRDSLANAFNPHAPVHAPLVFSSATVRVYALPTHRIFNEERFQDLLKQATATDWPESPARGTTPLSWSTWRQHLKVSLTARFSS
jgi:hypothetical protein